MMLQDVWKANIEWDDQLPIDILNRWNKFYAERECFKEVKIPRYIDNLHSSKFELHGFCDASSKAYAAVLYIRIISNSSRVFLLASKTRVAPVQSVTLPRLELCGALLLAELFNKLNESVRIPLQNIYFWSDSTITLSWIDNPPSKGNQFVQHRVSKINSFTLKEQWHHIPGKMNIADCASRGLYPQQLLAHTEWFEGPKWLYDFDPASLDTEISTLHPPPIMEDIPTTSLTTLTDSTQPINSFDFIEKFSSYMKLVRTIAWIFRFYRNIKSDSKTTGPLQSSELKFSIKTIVQVVQKLSFSEEIKLIQNHKPLPKSSKIIALNPFLDEEGILRVGGRLRHQQDLTFDQKFPMLIPKHHHLTILIIRYHHQINLHAGQELVLSLIRQTFWIPDGKSTVRKELRNCITCCKRSARPISQMMGDLPPERITPCRAFQKVGIDFAGPILTKCQHLRKAAQFKSYLCIFICMCTKAVHLEVVSSLSTSAFLATLRRFVSRRGYPCDIYSDQGRNFIGASAYLKELFKLPYDPTIQDYSSQRNIQWHFIPPYTPNFGGLWEAAVKLTKNHLVKACNSALLNFEELTTLLCQIEACINSRPLYPLSPDPDDYQALTPAHFLIGSPLVAIPDNNDNSCSLSYHSRWALLQDIKERFWKRWQISYLNTLQPRTKWMQHSQRINAGDLVLLKEATTNATLWTLGRIKEIHPGMDNIVRVATIRTSKGIVKRPISQVYLLPLTENCDITSPAGVCTE